MLIEYNLNETTNFRENAKENTMGNDLPDDIHELTDEAIIAFFTNKRGRINANKVRQGFLDKYPAVEAYLENRYEEFRGYGYTIQCIFLGLDSLPRCELCGKVLDDPKRHRCSPSCQSFHDADTIVDADIIRFFSDRRGKIDPNKTRESFLMGYPAIKTYLENRYEEFIGYTPTLQCIFAGLEELPRCENCGKILHRPNQRWCNVQCQLTDKAFIAERDANIDHEARARKFRETCQERYGVNAPAQNPDIMAKMLDGRDDSAAAAKTRETVRERYGVDCVFQLKSVQEKSRQTKLRKRPEDPCNHQKQEQTMLERYGVKSALCNGELRNKGRQTMLKRYGTADYVNVNATAETKRKRYGDPKYNNHEKARQTCMERYGVPSFSQTLEYAHKRSKTYLWKGVVFDSMPELAYYIYQTEHNHKVIYEPVAIPYEYDGEQHMYIPDFSVDGKLIEIKGEHFFEDGKMINPFGRHMDGLFEAKHQCMLENDVTVITDCTEYMQYVANEYGKDFLSRCKVPKTLSLDYLEYPRVLTVGNINTAVKKAQWREFYKHEIECWETNNNTLRLRLYENRLKYLGKDACDLTHYEILRGLKIGGFVKGYSRFNPKMFQQFLDEYDITSVYDPCAGWGERILVAYAQDIPYLGIDVNEALLPGYESLIKEYGMQQQVFVVADSSTYLPSRHYDAMFTCPPYFNQEIYSPSGAENLPHDEFLDWWHKTVENAMSMNPRYIAYQVNQKTKLALNAVMLDLGLHLVGELNLPREASHFTHSTKTEYESIEIFALTEEP